jgi:hypothetical protein
MPYLLAFNPVKIKIPMKALIYILILFFFTGKTVFAQVPPESGSGQDTWEYDPITLSRKKQDPVMVSVFLKDGKYGLKKDSLVVLTPIYDNL